MAGLCSAGRDGEYSLFNNRVNFAFDNPQRFRESIDRLAPTLTIPQYDRSYSYPQIYVFAQDRFPGLVAAQPELRDSL